MLTFFSLPSLSLSLSPLPNLVLFSQVIAFDKLDYCASLHNLDEIKDKPNFKVSFGRREEKEEEKKPTRLSSSSLVEEKREREKLFFFRSKRSPERAETTRGSSARSLPRPLETSETRFPPFRAEREDVRVPKGRQRARHLPRLVSFFLLFQLKRGS